MLAVAKSFRLRSFVRRDSRQTSGQLRAFQRMWPRFGLTVTEGQLNPQSVFQRQAPLYLEIGFGSGQSLLALAEQWPECDFLGVEPHKPGVGALLLGLEAKALMNVRVYQEDVVDVLATCISANSLDGVSIFFPDPWQKRRHHPRRLIQADFINTVINAMKPQGTLHLATDWDDYATHMMRVLSANPRIRNLAGEGQWAARSIRRPIQTKFECRALREGRQIYELQFEKNSGC